MESSEQHPQRFHFEEAFAEMIRDEVSQKEVFTGRQDYRDEVSENLSTRPLYQKLNQAFDEIYKFESAVGNFFEYFKQSFDDGKRAEGAS